LKILVVDDESGTVNAIRASLVSCGYEVAVATNGRDALERIQQSIEASESVDVMVADFIMPGMNGLELIRASRRLVPKLPTIMITAYGVQSVRDNVTDLNHCDFLEKPFDLHELKNAITKLLTTVR
jgi:CheY-like chemotaxis protein